MSQARITLRPPPNVEFVEGYPGIPAGRDRSHAEVRGTIEVRLPAQGTKTKWVRVELKKVETLPGGGQSNTFYDFVGPSPVKVWEASGEWSLLNTRDFPFTIRIPESIPPSIALEKSAGIKYELNATLCMKGKSGFFFNFFKKKDAILSTSHTIIIDKHELHSTWPVYAQPESRHVIEDLLMLTVDRTHTCYGPGDRVKVLATFKNDGIPAAALRAFEFLLKETIIYRAGANVSGKKRAPQIHVAPIGEQKVPVNMTVYQGQQHRAELGCFIPQTHTTTTVGSARHIDISYSIQVKAVLAQGKPLLIDLPVTVSNWPRNMSIEAVRRIGPAPNLSLIAPINISHPTAPATIAVTRPSTQSQQPGYNTAPARSGLFPTQNQLANERNASQTMSQSSSQYGDPVTGPRSNYDEFGLTAAAGPSHSAVPRGASPAILADHNGVAMRRPPVGTNTSRRLTLANAEMDMDPDSHPSVQPSSPKQNGLTLDEVEQHQNAPAGASGSSVDVAYDRPSQPRTTAPQRSAWLTAEEEKQRLFNQARQQALKTQASMGINLSLMPEVSGPTRQDSVRLPLTMPTPEPQPATKPPPSKKNTPWPTAEDEKLRLYREAQNAAHRTQAQGLSESGLSSGSDANGESPPPNKSHFHERAGSSHNARAMKDDVTVYPAKGVQPTETKSAGVQLYQHALASMSKNIPPIQTSVQPAHLSSPPAHKPTNPNGSQRTYPTAEEEKAAMRYYEAKRAVDRHQQVSDTDELEMTLSPAPGEGPIAYEDLYPAGTSSGQAGSSQMVNGYGRRMDDGDNDLPPPISPPPASMIQSAMSEKERLRRKYEAEDAAAAAGPPTPPTRASGSRSSPPGYGNSPPSSSRSQPLPPTNYAGPRLLTAAEEKARLRAQMEADERAAGGSSMPSGPPTRSPSMSTSYANHEPVEEGIPPPPPPLAPRPPAEYIQQTKEEDLRSQAENVIIPPTSQLSVDDTPVDFGLPFRPFSPLDLGMNFDSLNKRARSVPPPPPLPPKVPVSQ